MEIEPRPIQVTALENYLLYIKFKNGEEKILDMKPVIREFPEVYKNLENVEYFKKVKPYGCSIIWENGEDVAPEILYHDSELIKY